MKKKNIELAYKGLDYFKILNEPQMYGFVFIHKSGDHSISLYETSPGIVWGD